MRLYDQETVLFIAVLLRRLYLSLPMVLTRFTQIGRGENAMKVKQGSAASFRLHGNGDATDNNWILPLPLQESPSHPQLYALPILSSCLLFLSGAIPRL